MENIDPNSRSVEQRYQKKTQLEHVLLRPDTYVGSVQHTEETVWVWDDQSKSMIKKQISFVPGLYKIFDEVLVNAADHQQRCAEKGIKMSKIEVDINKEKGMISVFNDGEGIPVDIHKEHGCPVPELIFGHLLAGENFDDTQKKLVGGRNGYGAKLANIFSTKFQVETQYQGKYYSQKWRNNMYKCEPHTIVKKSGSDWTRISFWPDFEKFGMQGFDEDLISLLQRRVIDIAATAISKGLKVSLNGEKVPVSDFSQYCNLFLSADGGDGEEQKIEKVFSNFGERWQVCIAASPDGQFDQVSFVNSIATIKGGEHVKYITDQVTSMLLTEVQKKHKAVAKHLKPVHVKTNLMVFVNARIENPAFSSQTKDTLTTKKSNFGSKCEIDKKFMNRVMKTDLIERILSFAQVRADKDMKKTDGKKKGKISVPKLEDANWAGSKRSSECTLILTEGDSAKALAVAGFAVVGRDQYGVFPLKGKLMNVRDASLKQQTDNKEIQNLKLILGLRHKEVYNDTKSLRYGHVMIMTDQDHDGSHIKGLLINLFQHGWPSLLKIEGFLQEFITPIVKVTKGQESKVFYTLPEYNRWREQKENKKWRAKYYKGLGTSTAAEARGYFSELERHTINFEWNSVEDDKSIDLAFGKKNANARKEWLQEKWSPDLYLDMDCDRLNISDFVNKELILFSMESNFRAIPSLMDGLKPGQRKILFCGFKRNLKQEIKVAQLAGYVSEKAAYHHGEASLTSTIVGLAQDYVGSNNIPLLVPAGMFGTRLAGGKDAASARYICTRLSPLARNIFSEHDDAVLKYLEDDGMSIEPEWYCPIVPMVLVNGSSGIGTGWSSAIPNYNVKDIVQALKDLMQEKEPAPLHPWYQGFTGTIEIHPKIKGTYQSIGKWEKLSDTKIRITELPLLTWTSSYQEQLEKWVETGVIKDFQNNCDDTTVNFTLTLTVEQMAEAEKVGIEKRLELCGNIATSNMVVFDKDYKLRRYATVEGILKDFYLVRLEMYHQRKTVLVQALTREVLILSNKARFILAVVNDQLKINKVAKAKLLATLEAEGYDKFPKVKKSGVKEDKTNNDEEESEADTEAEGTSSKTDTDYDYLLRMALWSLTLERVEALKAEKKIKEAELAELKATDPKTLWTRDLDALLEAQENQPKEKTVVRKKANKKKMDDDDDDDWKPQAKKKSAPKKAAASKPAAPKPLSLNKPTLTVAKAEPAKAEPAKKPQAAPKPKKAANPWSGSESENDDESMYVEEDDDEDDDWNAKPTKPKKGSDKAAKASKPAKPSSKESKPPKATTNAAKSKAAESKPKKKLAPKAKTVPKLHSDNDDESVGASDVDMKTETAVPARARPGRTAAAKKVNYAVDNEDSDFDHEDQSEESEAEEQEDEQEDEQEEEEEVVKPQPKKEVPKPQPKKAAVNGDASDAEEEPLSLMERLQAKTVQPPAKKQVKNAAKKATADDDDEEELSPSLVKEVTKGSNKRKSWESASDESELAEPDLQSKAKKAKKAPAKPAAKLKAKKASAKKHSDSEDEELMPKAAPKSKAKPTGKKASTKQDSDSEEERDEDEDVLAVKSKPVPKPTAAKATKAKPAAKPNAKPAPKKDIYSDGDDDDEDYEEAYGAEKAFAVARPGRAARARGPISYAEPDSMDEDESEYEPSD